MSILVIGQAEEEEIRKALAAAYANPTPLAVVRAIADTSPTTKLMLADRKAGVEEARRKYPSHQVLLGTYRAAVSFEQQPAGLMMHLSVSSHHAGKIPGPEVLHLVAQAFGFSRIICDAFLPSHDRKPIPPSHPARVWAEEFEPGHMAINIIELSKVLA